jgi:hypothetical protein
VCRTRRQNAELSATRARLQALELEKRALVAQHKQELNDVLERFERRRARWARPPETDAAQPPVSLATCALPTPALNPRGPRLPLAAVCSAHALPSDMPFSDSRRWTSDAASADAWRPDPAPDRDTLLESLANLRRQAELFSQTLPGALAAAPDTIAQPRRTLTVPPDGYGGGVDTDADGFASPAAGPLPRGARGTMSRSESASYRADEDFGSHLADFQRQNEALRRQIARNALLSAR